MKLSECRVGEVVQNIMTKEIGHIVGLALNSSGETIPIVSYPYPMMGGEVPLNGKKIVTHFMNLKKLED